jgi:acyl carrier protein
VTEEEKIINAIFDAVELLNEQLPREQQLERSIDAVLFGKEGKLDSIGLVNLIVAVEENIEEEFGIIVTLADEKAMSQKKNPFQSLKSLADYIKILLAENKN